MFPILKIELDEVAELRLNVLDLADTNLADPKCAGRCYAYAYDGLAAEAGDLKTTCHLWLLHHAIAALWEEHPKQKVFICYEAMATMMRLFICSKRPVPPAKIHKVLSRSPAYVETGMDLLRFSKIRPLVYWEPPSSMMALWPAGMSGEIDEDRVIDSGQLLSWNSYPESDHAHSVPVDQAGPDYTRVPTDEHSSFTLNDRLYRFVNRWGVVV